LKRRDGYQKFRAGTRNAIRLAQNRFVFVNVFDHIQRGDQIKRCVRERNLARRIALANVIAARLRHRDRARIDFDAFHATVARKMMDHISRPATDIEHIAVAARDVRIEQIQERPCPRGEPPMLVFRQFADRWFRLGLRGNGSISSVILRPFYTDSPSRAIGAKKLAKG